MPLKGYILPIASRCAELFAAAINAGWISIQDPIENEDLLHYYHLLGFNQRDPFDPRTMHCSSVSAEHSAALQPHFIRLIITSIWRYV